MWSHHMFIVALVASCSLLSPAESGNTTDNTGNGLSGNDAKFTFIKGPWAETNVGSVYSLTIGRQRGEEGDCELAIGVKGSELGKTIDFECSGYARGTRNIRNLADLLLIGNHDDTFCVFTTNTNEIYYLKDGKWKKGDFSRDNSKDKELTSSEIDQVKERISKWQAFFEKSDKEIQRIRGLKIAEQEKLSEERDRIVDLLHQERRKRIENISKINQLKTEERNKYSLEGNKIIERIKTEGWSETVVEMILADEKRHKKVEAELKEMREKEDKRYRTVVNEYYKKINEEESKSEEEIKKLNDLENEEEERALQELKENIKQGW